MSALSILDNFPERIGRAQWWLGMSAIGAVLIAARSFGAQENLPVAIGAVLVSLAIFIPVTISRLHDRNRSSSTAFSCFMAAGLVAKLFRHTLDDDVRWMAIAAVGIAFATWAVIELGILRGTVGRNPYGEDPLGGEAS